MTKYEMNEIDHIDLGPTAITVFEDEGAVALLINTPVSGITRVVLGRNNSRDLAALADLYSSLESDGRAPSRTWRDQSDLRTVSLRALDDSGIFWGEAELVVREKQVVLARCLLDSGDQFRLASALRKAARLGRFTEEEALSQ